MLKCTLWNGANVLALTLTPICTQYNTKNVSSIFFLIRKKLNINWNIKWLHLENIHLQNDTSVINIATLHLKLNNLQPKTINQIYKSPQLQILLRVTYNLSSIWYNMIVDFLSWFDYAPVLINFDSEWMQVGKRSLPHRSHSVLIFKI